MPEQAGLAEKKQSSASQLQAEALRKKLEDDIRSLDWSAWVTGKRAFQIKIVSLIFASSTTVLVGAGRQGFPEIALAYLSLFALITSAVATGLASWEAFFSYRERSGAFTEAAQTLRRVKDELEYKSAAGELTQTKLDELFGRYQKALQQAHTGWIAKSDKKGG